MKAARFRASWSSILRALVVSAVVVVPLVVYPGESGFRVAKNAAYVLHGVLIVAATAIALVWRRTSIDWSVVRRPEWILALAVLGWGAVTTLTSTNRALSGFSFVWIATGVAFFLAAAATARDRSPAAVFWPAIPAAVNGVLLVLQVTNVWNPIRFPKAVDEYQVKKLTHTALFGNPNDVGAYFVVPALACLAAAIAARGRRRQLAIAAAAVFTLSVFLSEALTAMLAIGAGAVVLIALASRRTVIIGALVVLAAGSAAFVLYPPLMNRARLLKAAIERRDYDSLMSGRITPFFVAVELTKQHPLVGVGPGCFGFRYLDTKLVVEKKYPQYLTGDLQMYHEVHNDHLQVLSQSGVPGYLLFLAALILLARQTTGSRDAFGERGRFVHLLSLPLATAFAVECLAGFPMELSSVLCTYLYYGALCVGWRE